MRRLKYLLSALLITVLLVVASAMLLIAIGSPWLITNIDKSLPGKFYRIERGAMPGREEIAALHAPANPYYPNGAPFLKIIRGVPGDLVTRQGQAFFINGTFIGNAKEKTRGDFPLTPGPTGIIPPQHFFIWTPHPDSYDSRYGEIGWVESRLIIGRAWRVL